MLFTKASEYALFAMIYIADKNNPVDVDEISNELSIPKSFLAKILQNLARNGLLKSYKGAKGGFNLTLNADKISLKSIINSAEKKSTSVFECSNSKDDCPSNKGEFCKIWHIFNALQGKVDDFLDTITLADLIQKEKI